MRIQRYYSRCKRVKTDFDIQEILKINQIQNIFDGFPKWKCPQKGNVIQYAKTPSIPSHPEMAAERAG